MGTCRVVIEAEPQSGVRNMAIDEALLEAALDHGECTVRWYRWKSATVSLGYFQDKDAAAAIPAFAGLDVVRRLTGGGAILHHHEWTYSCSVPPGHPLSQTPSQIYELVHARIITGLAKLGVGAAALRGSNNASAEGEFLCFGRGDCRDVVLAGQKIVGSAQRRRRGAVLQHGSLLLRRSEYAPQFPGVFDLAVCGPFDTDVIRWLGESIGTIFGNPRIADEYQKSVQDRALELDARYRTLDWGRRVSS